MVIVEGTRRKLCESTKESRESTIESYVSTIESCESTIEVWRPLYVKVLYEIY